MHGRILCVVPKEQYKKADAWYKKYMDAIDVDEVHESMYDTVDYVSNCESDEREIMLKETLPECFADGFKRTGTNTFSLSAGFQNQFFKNKFSQVRKQFARLEEEDFSRSRYKVYGLAELLTGKFDMYVYEWCECCYYVKTLDDWAADVAYSFDHRDSAEFVITDVLDYHI